MVLKLDMIAVLVLRCSYTVATGQQAPTLGRLVRTYCPKGLTVGSDFLVDSSRLDSDTPSSGSATQARQRALREQAFCRSHRVLQPGHRKQLLQPRLVRQQEVSAHRKGFPPVVLPLTWSLNWLFGMSSSCWLGNVLAPVVLSTSLLWHDQSAC